MTSLVDKLVPEDLWAIVKPYCHHHTATLRRPTPHHPRPQCFAAIVFMTRTSTPFPGGCYLPESLAAVRQRRPDGGLTSGPRRGCSRRCTWRSSTDSANRAGWTGLVRAWTRPACAPNRGTTSAQIPSTAASRDPSFTWPVSAVGYRAPHRPGAVLAGTRRAHPAAHPHHRPAPGGGVAGRPLPRHRRPAAPQPRRPNPTAAPLAWASTLDRLRRLHPDDFHTRYQAELASIRGHRPAEEEVRRPARYAS